MGKPVNSIKEEGISTLVEKIKEQLKDVSVPTLEKIENEPCFYSPVHRSFDLSKIYWFIYVDNSEFCGPIRGGYEYLAHIPTCGGCLYGLKIDIDAVPPSSKTYKIAVEFAERIFLKARRFRN